MPTLFRFVNGDAVVQQYLTTTERGAVTRWQQTTGWQFEFHGGHLTGNPVYVRPDGNSDKKNLPKMDTKNKSAVHYPAISSFANGGKLSNELDNLQQADLLAIVRASFDTLALLAQRFWVDGPPDVTVTPVIVVTKKCTACQADMPFKGQGMKTQCPVCYSFC